MSGATTRDVRVRVAEERDLERILAIEQASFADAWTIGGFRELLAHPHARVEVAGDGEGGLIGYSVAWFVADESEIANLAVAPSARRRGVASLLLARVLERAAALGARSVFLEVRESNAAARALYEAHGFLVAGRRTQYYRLPAEDALVMRKKL